MSIILLKIFRRLKSRAQDPVLGQNRILIPEHIYGGRITLSRYEQIKGESKFGTLREARKNLVFNIIIIRNGSEKTRLNTLQDILYVQEVVTLQKKY